MYMYVDDIVVEVSASKQRGPLLMTRRYGDMTRWTYDISEPVSEESQGQRGVAEETTNEY